MTGATQNPGTPPRSSRTRLSVRGVPLGANFTVIFAAIFAVTVLAMSSACATRHDGATLYAALGEKPGIDAITDDFLYALADNPRALPLFRNTDIGRFRTQFATQICAIAGGPCTYTGDSMAQTHRGMGIDRAQFNSVVSDLVSAMENQGIDTSAQNALLQRFAALYAEIVHQ